MIFKIMLLDGFSQRIKEELEERMKNQTLDLGRKN